MAKARKEKGFILVIMLSLLLLLAVTAMSLNVKSGMQARMDANRTVDAQTYYNQLAVIEQSLWKLTGDYSWRTLPGGEPYPYHGVTYSRTVTGSAIASYGDVVTLSVRAPNATRTVNKSFRYNIDTSFLIRKPGQVCLDSVGNIFFVDYDKHSVWKVDALSGAILRVAGRGTSGFSGDGGPATQAQLDSPRGIGTDGMGNLYIADTNNHRIRKVSAGFISTVVNTSGGAGSSGDGGLAKAAQLNSPSGVWVDASGNIYIADRDNNITDTGNNRIRKVTAATGIINTIVNTTGTAGSSGDGGLATAAMLNKPNGVCLDASGNIYIADTENHRIRKVTVATGIINTIVNTTGVAGDSGDNGPATAAQLRKPQSVFVDSALNLYIADTDNHRIRKVTAASGIITTFAGTGTAGYGGDGGPATNALIDWPNGVCVKSTGEVIISDTNNSCLRQVSVTNTISTLPMTAGPGLNVAQGVATYYDVALKTLFLYIADSGNHRIRKLNTATNAIVTVAGMGSAGSAGDDGPAIAAQLTSPAAVTLDTDGNFYIADTGNNKIRKVTAATGIITTVAGTGTAGYSGDGGSGLAVNAKLNSPTGVAVDTTGYIYIADTNNHRIRVVKNSKISTAAGNGSPGYSGDEGNAASAQINAPHGISIDNLGDLYIADTDNHCIRKVRNSNSIISTVAGTGGTAGYSGDGGAATAAQLRSPRGVSVGTAKNIYIADTGNHALRRVNNAGATINPGVIATMAGAGTGGYNGDNQPAVQAWLRSPCGVALGLTKGGGHVFISDTANNRIRTLFLKTVPQVYGP